MLFRSVFDGVRVPLLIEPSTANRDLAALLAENEQAIHAALLERGAILFRGFGTDSLASFEHAVAAMSADRVGYRYGSTSRTHKGNRIFTATEYPRLRRKFRCITRMRISGNGQRESRSAACGPPLMVETPLADMRKVMTALAPGVLERFRTRQVRYVRHYHPYVDVPPSTTSITSGSRATS